MIQVLIEQVNNLTVLTLNLLLIYLISIPEPVVRICDIYICTDFPLIWGVKVVHIIDTDKYLASVQTLGSLHATN